MSLSFVSLSEHLPSPLRPKLPSPSYGWWQAHLILSIGLWRLPGSPWLSTPCRCYIFKVGWGRRGCAGPMTCPRRHLTPCISSPRACTVALFFFLCIRGQERKFGALFLQQHFNAGVQAAVLSKGDTLIGGLWGWGARTGR